LRKRGVEGIDHAGIGGKENSTIQSCPGDRLEKKAEVIENRKHADGRPRKRGALHKSLGVLLNR